MRDELVKVGRPVFFNPGQAGRISATTFLNIFILNIHARQIYNKQATHTKIIYISPKFAYLIGSDPKKAKRRIYSILIMLNISPTYIYWIMMQNVVEYQASSMKDHPHIKKIEVVADRLLQVIYYPKNLKSDYAKLQYRIKLEFPLNYPEKPPIVRFVGSINHPNICSKTGQVKMPLLQEDWSSYFTLYIIIDLLDTLLMEPQTDQKYCPNSKLKGSTTRGTSEQYEKDQIQSIKSSRPVQSLKKTMKTMKTIILEKADGNECVESMELRGSIRKSQNQRKQLTVNNKLSKITQEKQSKIHANNNAQSQKNQQQLRTTTKSTKPSPKTFYIPPLQNKSFIQHDMSILVLSRNTDILSKSRSSGKQVRRDKITIPKLNRDIIDQDFIDLHRDILKTNSNFQDFNYQLDKIKKLLNDFYSDYEDLAMRRSSTKSPQLIEIIQQKMREELGLIEQLNNLALLIKKKMIRDVRNCIPK